VLHGTGGSFCPRGVPFGMSRRRGLVFQSSTPVAAIFLLTFCCGRGLAQKPPVSPDRPWTPTQKQSPEGEITKYAGKEFQLSPDKTYTLPELVDLAERHNPETRAAWESAKAAAGALGVARSDLYPTLAAAAMGQTYQTGVLFGAGFVKQILGIAQGDFTLDYTLFDFGSRLDRIARERSNLISANFAFNDVHRHIIFQVMASYYQLLNAKGQRDAAEANLVNAKAVQAASEARLEHGLATLPDVLEARSATAQAEYDLQDRIGAEEIASGDLATALMASPASVFKVQDIEAFYVPEQLTESAEDAIRRALGQRPDMLERAEDVRGAEADIRQARSAFYPNLTFQGMYGYLRAFGEQPPFPGTYAGSPVYNAQLNLSWTIFDGGRRRSSLVEAKAVEKRAEAQVAAMRDQISDEVWRSYSDVKTALRQRQAAATLLSASSSSYNAALESYNYGVRNILDVLSSQRALAQARSSDVSARARVLTSFADLAYRTGDLLHAPAVRRNP